MTGLELLVPLNVEFAYWGQCKLVTLRPLDQLAYKKVQRIFVFTASANSYKREGVSVIQEAWNLE